MPLTVTFCDVAPCPRLFGLSEVTVGAGFTVKVDVPDCVSGFVTVRVRAPVDAPAPTATGTVSVVELTNVVDPTVSPVPEIARRHR